MTSKVLLFPMLLTVAFVALLAPVNARARVEHAVIKVNHDHPFVQAIRHWLGPYRLKKLYAKYDLAGEIELEKRRLIEIVNKVEIESELQTYDAHVVKLNDGHPFVQAIQHWLGPDWIKKLGEKYDEAGEIYDKINDKAYNFVKELEKHGLIEIVNKAEIESELPMHDDHPKALSIKHGHKEMSEVKLETVRSRTV